MGRGMLRKLKLVLLPVAACAGLAPAQAAPIVKTVSISGTAGNYCSVSGTIPLSFTAKSNGSGTQFPTQNMNTTNLAYNIACNVKSSLTMGATALFTSNPPGTGDSKIANYTATLSPWGSGSVSATTAAPSTDPGTTLYPTTPTPVSSGGAVSASGTVAISNITRPSGTNQWEKNQVYGANITLVLTPNN